MEPATDLDILVSRGFGRGESQQALRQTRGDVDAAAKLMVTGQGAEEWADSVPGEWRDNVDSQVPYNAKSRALWKSKFYISIPSWNRKQISDGEEKIFYSIGVIMRDGRHWKMEKSFSSFRNFWRSLPFGALNHFKTPFPQPFIRLTAPTEEMIEQRRLQLDQWMQELCLDEKSMTNAKVEQVLSDFIGAEEHDAEPTAAGGSGDALEWTLIPTGPNHTAFHLSLEDFSKTFPCKIDTVDVIGPAAPSGQDTSTTQIKKDLLRDRIIIQGRRVEGAQSGLEGVLRIAAQAAADVITSSAGTVISTESLRAHPTGVPGPSDFSLEMIDELCITALQQIGRTESAFISFSCLHHAVDMALQPDIIVVPESTLARPLLMRFRREEGEPVKHTPAKTGVISPKTSTIPAVAPRQAATASVSSTCTGGSAIPMSIRDRVTKTGTPIRSTPVSSSGPARLASTSSSPTSCGGGTSGSSSGGGKSAMMSYIHSMQTPTNPLICDLQAATVYRFADAMTMETILQVKATFCRSIKLNALNAKTKAELIRGESISSSESNGDAAAPDAVHCERNTERVHFLRNQFVYSKNYVVIDRETKTSTRDWKVEG